MDATDLASTVPGTDSRQRRVFAAVVAASTLLGVVHHVDHVVRGNHVGWPLTGEVNAFTVSLAVYPLLAAGLYLTAADRAGTRYWAWFFTGTAAVLAFVHVGPWALEPPGDVIGHTGTGQSATRRSPWWSRSSRQSRRVPSTQSRSGTAASRDVRVHLSMAPRRTRATGRGRSWYRR